MSRFAVNQAYFNGQPLNADQSIGAGRGLPRRQALNRTGINANSRRELDSGGGVSYIPRHPNTRKIRASFRLFPAASQGEPERGADRLASADAARRHDPAVERRHLFLAAAGLPRAARRSSRSCARSRTRPGAQEVLMPTLQPADLGARAGVTTITARRCCASATGTSATCSTARPTRSMITDIFRDCGQELSRPAAEPLSHPVEVPRRGAAALRRHARARVPDEGRLFLRSRRRPAPALLQQDVRRLSATFARMGLKAIPMRADTGPIGGDLSHEFIILAETGESAVYCDKAWLEIDMLAADIDYDGDLEPFFKQWTSLYAATDEKHDPANSPRAGGRSSSRRAASRSATSSISAPSTRSRWVPWSPARRRDGRASRWAPTASASRAWSARSSRRATTMPASSGRRASRRSGSALINLRAADAECDAACDELYASCAAPASTCSTTIATNRAGAKFAAMDLIGLPWQLVVGPRGLAERHGRAEEPRDRRAQEESPPRRRSTQAWRRR